MSKIKKGKKMQLTKIAAVTLSAALIFGCDDLEFKETTSTDTDSGSEETDTGTDTSSETGQYAVLTNIEADSSGQLRYDVAEAQGEELTEGQLNVDVFYSSSETETTYISLFNADTNTSGLIGEVQLDEGNVKVRSGDSTTVSTFTTDTWVNVNVTWDVATATYTVSINDSVIGTYNFHNPDATGVDTIGFKVANNAATDSEEFLVDNIAIYSDAAGTTEVFSDDFEDYALEEVLDGVDDPYNDETQPAVVGGEASDDTTDTDTDTDTESNQVAKISDTLDSDTGELRYKFDATDTTGAANVSVYYEVGGEQTAYVTLYDEGHSTSSLIADIRLKSGNVTIRTADESSASTGLTFPEGEWFDVNLTWDTETTNQYTLTVNGVESGPYSAKSANPVQTVALRFNDNSGVTAESVYFDNLEIYSDEEASTELFSDDFDTQALDFDLDADPYNSATSEAVVAADPSTAE